ncbi:MAG: LamG domain-containing protein [Aeoliella sp.]
MPLKRSCVVSCSAGFHCALIVSCLLGVGCQKSLTTVSETEPAADATKSPLVSAEGLLGHWKFDGDLSDSSPHGHKGEPIGDPEFSGGKVGQAIQLDGRSQSVEIPQLAADVTQFTLAFWMYVDAMPSPQTYVAIYHNNGWEAGDVHLPFTSADGTVDLGIKGNEPDMSIPTFKVTEMQQRWVHMAVSYDAAESKQVRFYVDGDLTDTFEIETAHPVQLGPGRIGGWDAQERWFLGRLDEVYFFDRVLGAADVAALFAQGEAN